VSILYVRLPPVKPVASRAFVVVGVRPGRSPVVLAERPTFYAAHLARRELIDGGIEGYSRLVIETAAPASA
jgi:hypothetical protein